MNESIKDNNEKDTELKQRKWSSHGAVEVKINSKIRKPDSTLFYNMRGTCPKGDIIAIKAKSKNGKTFLASIFAAAILGAELYNFTTANKKSKVLYFDTEQNQANTFKVMRRIYVMCEWSLDNDSNRLKAYNLREMEVKDRLHYIISKIKYEKPTAVFVDGIADLISNFNDIEESSQIIQSLMRTSSKYSCAVFIVIHTNKGKDDNSMKGHLGTMAWQKCADVFNVEKQKDKSFLVTESDCRNIPISDFYFKISSDGIPFLPISLNECPDDEEELEDLE